MDILNSLFVSVFGMTVVFFALILLIVMINVITFAMKKAEDIQRQRAAAAAAVALPAAGHAPSAGPASAAPALPASLAAQPEAPSASARIVPAPPTELRLTNVDETTAALIMAIVCDESGIPPEELYFKSISLMET